MAEAKISSVKAGASCWVETLLEATNADRADLNLSLRGCVHLHSPAALAEQSGTSVHSCLAALRGDAHVLHHMRKNSENWY